MVAAGRNDDLVVGRELGGRDRVGVAAKLDRLPGLGVPDSRRVILARGDDLRSVVTEDRVCDAAGVTDQLEWLAAREAPDTRDVIAGDRQDATSIGAEGRGEYRCWV